MSVALSAACAATGADGTKLAKPINAINGKSASRIGVLSEGGCGNKNAGG
jgi:hypothetical protein